MLGQFAKSCRHATILGALLCWWLLISLPAGVKRPAKQRHWSSRSVWGSKPLQRAHTGNEVVVLEEATDIKLEEGPQRTLAMVQSDGQYRAALQPPSGGSVELRGASSRRDFRQSNPTGYGCGLVGSIQTARFEATNYFLNPPPQPIRSFTMDGGSRMTTALSACIEA